MLAQICGRRARVVVAMLCRDSGYRALAELDEKIRSVCPLLGKRLVITGTSRKDLNGRIGVATSFDHDRDRYVVELDSREGENEKERLKVKPENLSLTKIARKQEKKRGK